jgi:hypothetical protein
MVFAGESKILRTCVSKLSVVVTKYLIKITYKRRDLF